MEFRYTVFGKVEQVMGRDTSEPVTQYMFHGTLTFDLGENVEDGSNEAPLAMKVPYDLWKRTRVGQTLVFTYSSHLKEVESA